MPKVSIIIPVYNVEKYLEECLDSVINQTFKDIEIICINDGSTDRSKKILDKYAKTDNRIKIYTIKNHGSGYARNMGMKKAIGDYIFFLDSDDYIDNESIEKLYDNAQRNQSDIVLFKMATTNDNKVNAYDNPRYLLENIFKHVNFDNFFFNYNGIKSYVMNENFSPCLKFYERNFLLNNKDLKFGQTKFEDVLFHIKILLTAEKISYVPEFFYYYRYNPNSITNTSSNGKDIIIVIEEVENYLKNNDYYNKFHGEFIYFKIKQLMNYLVSTNSEDYFEYSKNYFESIYEKFIKNPFFNSNLMPQYLLNEMELVVQSSSLEVYLLNMKIHEMNEQITMLNKNNDELKFNNENKQQTIQRLENEIEKNNLNHEEKIKKLNNEIFSLQNTNTKIQKEYDENINHLKVEKSLLEKDLDNISIKNKNLIEIQQKNLELINNLNNNIDFLDNKITQLNNSLQEQIFENANLTTQYNILNNQHDEIKIINDKLMLSNQKLIEENDNINKEKSDLQQKFYEFKISHNSLIDSSLNKLGVKEDVLFNENDYNLKFKLFIDNVFFNIENYEYECNQLKKKQSEENIIIIQKSEELKKTNQNLINSKTIIKSKENKINQLQKQIKDLSIFKENVYKSKSWKYTKPLRLLKQII